MKKDIRKDIFTIIAVTVAAFLMALNTKTFVNTGGLYPGGMTGMSILIQRAVKQLAGIMLPFSIINITLNIIPVYIGFRFIGKKFTAFSCVMILLNSFFTDLIPNHIITQDVLLISIFGALPLASALIVVQHQVERTLYPFIFQRKAIWTHSMLYLASMRSYCALQALCSAGTKHCILSSFNMLQQLFCICSTKNSSKAPCLS